MWKKVGKKWRIAVIEEVNRTKKKEQKSTSKGKLFWDKVKEM